MTERLSALQPASPGDWLRAYLTAAAARELAARERSYPADVAAGTLGRDEAEADLAAWRAIAGLFEHGSVATDATWSDLAAAAARALARRDAACAAAPADSALALRRDAVAAIHERVEWHRGFGRNGPALGPSGGRSNGPMASADAPERKTANG